MVVVMAVVATAEGGTYRVGVGDRIAFGWGVATGDLILCFVASGTTALESFLVQFELFLCRPFWEGWRWPQSGSIAKPPHVFDAAALGISNGGGG